MLDATEGLEIRLADAHAVARGGRAEISLGDLPSLVEEVGLARVVAREGTFSIERVEVRRHDARVRGDVECAVRDLADALVGALEAERGPAQLTGAAALVVTDVRRGAGRLGLAPGEFLSESLRVEGDATRSRDLRFLVKRRIEDAALRDCLDQQGRSVPLMGRVATMSVHDRRGADRFEAVARRRFEPADACPEGRVPTEAESHAAGSFDDAETWRWLAEALDVLRAAGGGVAPAAD